MPYYNPDAEMRFPPAGAVWTRWLVAGLACSAAAFLLLAAIPVLFGTPRPMVAITWRDVSAPDRAAAEARLRLSEATVIGDRQWRYVPLDTSASALVAIVSHPFVEDTDGIDRSAFRIADRPPLTERRGGPLSGIAWMAGAVRLAAYLLVAMAVVLGGRAAALSPMFGLGSTFRSRLGALTATLWNGTKGLPAAIWTAFRPGARSPSAEVIGIVGVFLATVAWRFLTFTGFTNDHYAHLALAQQMLLGDVPVRDFADPGWPLAYLLTAAGWLLAGRSLAVEWTITAVGFGLGAACTFAVALRLSRWLPVALLVTIAEVLIYPRTYSYPKMFVYGAGAWIILTLTAAPSHRRIWLCAWAVAIAFLLRHDHGLFLGVAAAAGLWLASLDQGWREASRRVVRLTICTAVILLPWTLFVMANGGLIEYFRGGIEYSRGESNATALRELPALALMPLDFGTANMIGWTFWLFWSLPVAAAIGAWRHARMAAEHWKGEPAAIAALVIVAVLVNASFMREALQVRVPDAVVPAALLGAWLFGLSWTRRWRTPALQRLVQALTLVCAIVTGVAVERVGGVPDQIDNAEAARGLRAMRERTDEVLTLLRSSHRSDTPSRYAVALLPFFAYLDRCTAPTDRLIVTSEYPDVLVLAGRRFAGDGVVFGVWYSSVERQDVTLERVRRDPALFTLHMGDYATFSERYALIDGYIREAYAPMAEVPVPGADTVRILVLRDRPSVGTDAQTGWPCFATVRG
jgi:hypothetical protein